MTVQTVREADFQQAVAEFAQLVGWRVAHFRPARNHRGRHMTPVAYDGVGWPDLVLVRDRLIVAELKTKQGRVTDQQQAWLDALAAAGVETYLWRPDDWPDIEAVLTRRRPEGH